MQNNKLELKIKISMYININR